MGHIVFSFTGEHTFWNYVSSITRCALRRISTHTMFLPSWELLQVSAWRFPDKSLFWVSNHMFAIYDLFSGLGAAVRYYTNLYERDNHLLTLWINYCKTRSHASTAVLFFQPPPHRQCAQTTAATYKMCTTSVSDVSVQMQEKWAENHKAWRTLPYHNRIKLSRQRCREIPISFGPDIFHPQGLVYLAKKYFIKKYLI